MSTVGLDPLLLGVVRSAHRVPRALLARLRLRLGVRPRLRLRVRPRLRLRL